MNSAIRNLLPQFPTAVPEERGLELLAVVRRHHHDAWRRRPIQDTTVDPAPQSHSLSVYTAQRNDSTLIRPAKVERRIGGAVVACGVDNADLEPP